MVRTKPVGTFKTVLHRPRQEANKSSDSPECGSKEESSRAAVVVALPDDEGERRPIRGWVGRRGGIREVASARKCHWPSGEQRNFIGLSCSDK